MEFRKLISFGNSSFVVSLPKSWVEKNKLNKGDLVYVEEKNDELALYPSNNKDKEESKEIVIEVNGKSVDSLHKEIIAAYINNYHNMIFVGSELKDKVPEVRDILNHLVALEIMEQSAERMVAKCFLTTKEVSLNDVIRRSDIIVRAMMDESQEVIEAGHPANHLSEKYKDVERLFYLGFRIIRGAFSSPALAKSLSKTPVELMDAWRLVLSLKRIAYQVMRITNLFHTFEMKKKDAQELYNVYAETIRDYHDAIKAFNTVNKKQSEKTADNVKKNLQKHDQLLTVYNKPGVANFLERIKTLERYVKDIAELTIDVP